MVKFRNIEKSLIKSILQVGPILALIIMYGCEQNRNNYNQPESIEIDSIGTVEDNNPIDKRPTIHITDLGKVTFYDPDAADESYILVNDAGNNRVYLMDKSANLIHEWNLAGKLLGNDNFLLPNGQLLAMLETDDPKIKLGGFGGKLQLLDKNGKVMWNFDYASENHILHHDAEMLPNGNIIAQVWEKKSKQEALSAGSTQNVDVYSEGIIEIDTATNEIVWAWYAWDHLVQESDENAENFGVVSENPHLIDLNYVEDENGDIMHANGLSYDVENDLIYLSVNFFSEIWVIDHSIPSEETSSHRGGNFEVGGDLVYRFGNPEAYGNNFGNRLFHHVHFPNLLKEEDKGKILVYSNGQDLKMSTVYELQLPGTLSLNTHTDNEPTVIWSFSNPELYAAKVSGAVKLPNGNRLITEGDFGIWEVTDGGKTVWQFESEGFFWRAYHYKKNAPELNALGL